MSNVLHVTCKDGAWPELRGKTIIHLPNATIWVNGLEAGMESGDPSVAIRIDLPDGTSVITETSLRLFLTAADALKAKLGDPRGEEITSEEPTPPKKQSN
jgi:hypothetical protein